MQHLGLRWRELFLRSTTFINSERRFNTYIGISLRYVWGSVLFCMVLINLILFNLLHKAIFELQHPIFMVIFAFATIVTGSILRNKLIILGGIVFGLLAYFSFFFSVTRTVAFGGNCMANCIGYSWSFTLCKTKQVKPCSTNWIRYCTRRVRLAIMSILVNVKAAESLAICWRTLIQQKEI